MRLPRRRRRIEHPVSLQSIVRVRKNTLVAAHALLLFVCQNSVSQPASEYGLPVRLGSSVAEVRNVLGQPDATDHSDDANGVLSDWYYAPGMIGTFNRDKLIAIMLPRDTPYAKFVPYAGTIVNGIKLTDSKESILQKMGRPVNVEEEELPEGTDPDVPARFAEYSKYTWRVNDMLVQVNFLAQAQQLDGGRSSLPKNATLQVIIRDPSVPLVGPVHHDH